MSRSNAGALGALLFFMALAGTSAQGATRTWKGGAGAGVWSNPAHWVEGQMPVNGDRVVFAATGALFSTNDLPNLRLTDIVFGTGPEYRLEGEAITLTSLTPLSVPGLNRTVSVLTPLRLPSGSPRILADGINDIAQLVLGGITLTGGTLKVQAPGSRVMLTGPITETAPSAVNLAARVVEIWGPNTFSGQLDITADQTRASDTAFGIGSAKTVVSGASGPLEIMSGATLPPVTEPFLLAGTKVDAGIGGWEFTAPIEIQGRQSTNGRHLRGVISGSGRLVVANSPFDSVMLYNPANAFTGGLELNEARLGLAAAGVVPDASELVIASYNAILELGPFEETVRRFECHEGTLRWTPSALLRVLQPSQLDRCRIQLDFPADYSVPPELTLIRNDSG